jgi:REP-associated tyrosine transposase
MARRPRSLLPDGFFHLTARGVARTAIYRDDGDFRFFLGLVRHVTERFAWRWHALCLMPNHYHFVVETTRAALSGGMHRVNGLYAEAFNMKYERSGHLFGDRFAARAIEDEEYVRAACRYVVYNPVRAGFCEHPADWPWTHSRYGFGDL